MLSVIDAMSASKGFVRPMREGEQLVQSGMVVAIGKKAKQNEVVHVQALVLRTSGLQSKDPAVVVLWIDLEKQYGDRVVQDNEEEFRQHCDCPAGNSEKCKHMIAVMLCLAGIQEHELDDLSCTDTEKQWGSLKASTLKEYEAKALADLCHVKGQRDIYVNQIPQVTKEMQDRWREKLMNCAPLSEISIFMSCLRMGQGSACCEEDNDSNCELRSSLIKNLLSFRSWRALGKVRLMTQKKVETLSPDLKEFYDSRVAVDLNESVVLCSAEQGTAEWKMSRKVRLTASKARAQFTYYKNKKANWDGRYKELYESAWRGNEDTERGLIDEVSCREKYEERYKCKVLESGLLVRPEVPWLAASLDGTSLDDNSNFIENIEVKSFKEGTRLSSTELIEYQAIPTLDENGNVKVNTQHYTQMQLGMLLSGIDRCSYCLWSRVDNDFAQVTVNFDEKHVLEICSRLVNVYFDIFLPRMFASLGSDKNNNGNVNEEEEDD